jgi:hypothetical protein
MPAKGEGKSYQWILAHVDYPHDDWCLVWPFARDKHGRGMMSHDGESHWAHRFMCKLVKGEPPTPEHTAAHSCGNGHGGCINPHHLGWKTQAENLEDCREHGTLVRHHGGNVRRVMPEEIEAIKAARGFQTQGHLAAKYGVSEGTISDIWHGRSHTRQSKVPHYTPEDDAKIREAIEAGQSYREIGALIGRAPHAVSGRVYRLGLRSKWINPHTADLGLSYSNGDQHHG